MSKESGEDAKPASNERIASKLREIADLLEAQRANPFRFNAYRRAANTISDLDQPLVEIINRRGTIGLIALPGIGEGIARSIAEYISTGHMSRLESLRAGSDPVALFQKIPGIGIKLSYRIIETLHIDTLEALEIAAHNGRLSHVPGFSENKVSLIKMWLAQTLGRSRTSQPEMTDVVEPSVELLLKVDRNYREKAAQDKLPKISPKRFNPTGERWLPILHQTVKGWHFTALFSNTDRARHALQ